MKTYFILAFVAIAISATLPAQEASLELPASGVVAKPTDPTVAEPETKPKKELSENDKIYISAQRFLNGINTEVNYKEALVRFAYLAELGEARALNALAGMLRQGMGVPQDRSTARELYAQASALGYGKASFNLAQMYKTAQGGEQDFQKAFEYFQEASNQGYKPAIFKLGYLYFKGFGVPQDYKEAVKYFSRGEKLELSPCTYFLGLCYLGGYGVGKDMEQGKRLIEQAAKMGNHLAVDFIVRNCIEMYEKPENIDPQGNYYPAYRKDSNNPNIHLTGSWIGRVLRYDYSGKAVIEDSPLFLQLATDEIGNLSGTWLQADTLVMIVQATQAKNAWKTKNMQYLKMWDSPCQVQSLRFTQELTLSGDTVLYATIEQFSPESVEPSSPTMLEIRRAKERITENELVLANKLRVSPNPFTDQLNLYFTLSQPEQIKFLLYDLYLLL